MGSLKIGVFVDGFRMGVRRGIEKAAELGVDGFQVYVTHGELAPWDLSDSGRKEFQAFVARQGLVISALCADFGKGFVDPALNDALISKTLQVVDLAVALEVPIITTHVGAVPDDPSHKDWILCAEAVKAIGDYAAARDVCFATETGPESGDHLRRFLESCDTPAARVNFDPANLVMWGFDPLQAARDLGPLIVHAHAKDGIANSCPNFREVPLGEGDVHFPEYLAVMREIGFDGYHVIERECGDDPVADIARAVAFLRQF